MKPRLAVLLGVAGVAALFGRPVSAQEGDAQPLDGAAAAQEEARRTTKLATVNDEVIDLGYYEDQLNKQGPFRRVQFTTAEKRREFLDELIDWELQAQEAERRRLGDDESVREQVKRVMSSLLLRREVDERVRPEDISAEEVSAFYEENSSTFHRPEKVRAYQIVIGDREKAQQLLKRIIDERIDNREFRKLARDMSEDPVTKRRGGDLRYFTRPEERTDEDPEVHPAIVKATFELLKTRLAAEERARRRGQKAPSPDDESAIDFTPVYPRLVQTPQGFHIIRFMGHREAVNRPLEEVERQIRNRLWREKLQKAREDFVADLRERHPVEIDDDALKLVKIEVAEFSRKLPPVKGGNRITPRGAPGAPGLSGPAGEVEEP